MSGFDELQGHDPQREEEIVVGQQAEGLVAAEAPGVATPGRQAGPGELRQSGPNPIPAASNQEAAADPEGQAGPPGKQVSGKK